VRGPASYIQRVQPWPPKPQLPKAARKFPRNAHADCPIGDLSCARTVFEWSVPRYCRRLKGTTNRVALRGTHEGGLLCLGVAS